MAAFLINVLLVVIKMDLKFDSFCFYRSLIVPRARGSPAHNRFPEAEGPESHQSKFAVLVIKYYVNF